MSDFQSIAHSSYRIAEISANGFPTNGVPTLSDMRERERTPYAQRLVEARKRAGLSQPQLAKLVGMAQGTLGEAETSAIGSKFTAQLARALKVRAEWLASGDGPMVDTGWPFPRIDLQRVLRLSEADLAYVEGRLAAALDLVEVTGVPESSTKPDKETLPYADGRASVTKSTPGRFPGEVLSTGRGGSSSGESHQPGKVPKRGSRGRA
jgi:transcriptional regulator with XRE-family HTH domain